MTMFHVKQKRKYMREIMHKYANKFRIRIKKKQYTKFQE